MYMMREGRNAIFLVDNATASLFSDKLEEDVYKRQRVGSMAWIRCWKKRCTSLLAGAA